MKTTSMQLPIILLVLCLASCLNKYEKELVGKYRVKPCKLPTAKIVPDNYLPTLVLNSDRTFIITDHDKTLAGSWEANDNREWAYINMYIDPNDEYPTLEGIVGNGTIKLWSNSDAILRDYKFIVFIKGK